MAMASSSEQEDRLEDGEETLWDIFRMVPWHFFGSLEWDNYVETFLSGPTLAEADQAMGAILASEGIDPDEPGHRIYVIVRGGKQLDSGSDMLLPVGAKILFVWQESYSIDPVPLDLNRAMGLQEAMKLAWDQVPHHSEVYTNARDSGYPADEPPGADLIVLGGELSYHGCA